MSTTGRLERNVAPPSYSALLRISALSRVLLGMQVARLGQQTAALGLVLFTLATYRSPELAGLVVFVGLVPGILLSPVAGALLDRHGRTRLIVLDLLVSMCALALVAGLAMAGSLPAWLLLCIAAIASLTAPLTNTRLMSLFPLMYRGTSGSALMR